LSDRNVLVAFGLDDLGSELPLGTEQAGLLERLHLLACVEKQDAVVAFLDRLFEMQLQDSGREEQIQQSTEIEI
jgi:hypothetical protein